MGMGMVAIRDGEKEVMVGDLMGDFVLLLSLSTFDAAF